MTNSLVIRDLKTEELDLWDGYVTQHPSHTPYHLLGWGKSVTEAYKQPVRYVAAFENGKIVGVLPVSEFKNLNGKKDLCSMPYCDLGGALANDDETKQALEHYLESRLNKESFRYSELRERYSHADESASLDGKKVSMLLTLPDSADELLSSFKSKLRSQIRKAEKNGLSYEIGCTSDYIDSFYDVLAENLHRLGSPVHSKSWFVVLMRELKENAVISIVKKGDLVVGAGLIIFTAQKVAIPWASTRVQYNNLSPNMLLYWSLLKYSCDNGANEFDFGRSTYNQGTYKFKKQWGCEPRLLNWRRQGETNDTLNVDSPDSKLRVAIESIWRSMPLSLANFLGPKLRRFISL